MAEAPRLWKKARLLVTAKNLSVMPGLLGTRRLRDLGMIHVFEESSVPPPEGAQCRRILLEELLRAVARHPGLNKVTFSSSDLSSVDAGLLARMVHGLDQVWMTDTRLARWKVEDIIGGITGQTKLNVLSMRGLLYSRIM